jgi:DNA repair protein RadA/Sms
MGKCNNCGEWNTFVEEIVETKSAGNKPVATKTKPQLLQEISNENRQRIITSDSELNRVCWVAASCPVL